LSSVKRWKKAWKQGGVQALAARPHPGPQCRLTAKQKQSLVRQLKRGPRAAGYRSELWTCRRVAEVVRKQFRVSYHPDHLGRMLHELGFTPQKPQQVARERDDEAVKHWRRYTWPSLKKELAEAAPRWSFSMKPAFDCNR
jgi:transposase